MKKHNTSLVLALMVCAAGSVPAWAQAAAGISGRVEDPTGAGVPGATITIKNAETGATRVVTTDGMGNYRAVALAVGPQEVKAEKPGFKAAVRAGIDLVVAQQATVDLKLEVGEFSQIVTVTEETPVVNTSTASVAGFVGEQQIKDLPLNGRSFDNLITLNPSAINYGLKSANTSTSNGNTFSVAGRRPLENLVLLNGVEYGGTSQLAVTPGGVSGDLLGIDAIREFNVLTDSYSAEYGKRAGAQVSAVTQSGSNTLHGSLFEFLRNSHTDARGPFDLGSPAPLHRNQFGGSLGGPIKKNKLFLFGNYEGFRQSVAATSVSVVPDAQARLGNLPNAAGTYVPVTGLNQAMLQYANLWPVANGPELLVNGLPTGTAKAIYNPRQTTHEDFGTTRADYNLSERDTFSAIYTLDNGNSLTPQADPLFASALALINQVGSLQETHVFSPTMLNTFRAGYSRSAYNFDSDPLMDFPPGLSFVTGYGPGGITVGGAATTTGSGAITAAGPNNAAGVWNRRNLFTYTDGVTIIKGRHSISTGVWFQRVQDNEDTASRQLGVAAFPSLTCFLTGTLTNFQVVPTANELGWRSLFGAWYVDDTIKLRRNLTVQVGLRQEFTTGWNEVSGRAANYVPNASGILQTNTVVGDSAFTQNNAKKLFAPRGAIAWDPFGKGQTVIRAGFGVYYDLIDDLSFQLNSLTPYNGTQTFTGKLTTVVPVLPNTPPLPNCSATVTTGCATFAPLGVQADAKTPTVEEWNVALEQQLDRNTSLRVAYVGSFGYHEFINIDPNSIAAQTCANAAGCQAGGTTSAGAPVGAALQSLVPQGASYIPVGTRPNPFLGAGFFWYTEGNSSYNALQIDVTRRLSRNLQFRANYTFSKNLDMNSGLTGAQAQNQSQMVLNRNNLRADWGPSALNATHQASISMHYELPVGKGKRFLSNANGVTNRIIGGWQFNEITTLLSGFPFTPVIGANISGDGNTRNPDRPNLNPAFTGPIVTGDPNQWFNPAAFLPPAFGTYGNLGRGVLTGPGLTDVDVSVMKNILVTERVSLQFRAEAFNLLNHANYGVPNQTTFVNLGTATAPNYQPSGSAGLISTLTTQPRQIQFGLKLMF